MNYELLTDAVVARLQPFTSAGVSVVRLPEKESEKKQVTPTTAKFTVICAGSEYADANSTAQISQNEKIYIQILVESTFLYGVKGVLSLASVLKMALTGFQAQGCTRFQLSKHNIIPDADRTNNMWQYQVIFQASSVHVENFEEDLSVIFSRIRFIDEDAEVTEIPDPLDN